MIPYILIWCIAVNGGCAPAAVRFDDRAACEAAMPAVQQAQPFRSFSARAVCVPAVTPKD